MKERAGSPIQRIEHDGGVDVSAIALLIFGGWIAEALFHIFQDNLVLHREDLFDKYQMGAMCWGRRRVIWALLPFLSSW